MEKKFYISKQSVLDDLWDSNPNILDDFLETYCLDLPNVGNIVDRFEDTIRQKGLSHTDIDLRLKDLEEIKSKLRTNFDQVVNDHIHSVIKEYIQNEDGPSESEQEDTSQPLC